MVRVPRGLMLRMLVAPFALAALAPSGAVRSLSTQAPTASAASRPDFASELARLRAGPAYAGDVPTGTLKRRHGEFPYWLVVPDHYDPAKRYKVRIQLHGGVMRPESELRGGGRVQLPGDEQLYILPSGWNERPWWSDAQVASLHAILEDVKHEYNVDENQVFVSGVSDGGTGTYYVAMRDTTPYAAFLPLNGYLLVLRSPQLDIRGDLFLNNLRNKPFFLVNGGKDPLYPTAIVEPTIGHLSRGGVSIVYRPQPEAGHDTSWWPVVKDDFEAFTRRHPRTPLPDAITWEVSETRTWNRAHWLIVDRLGATPNDATDLPDLNQTGGVPVFRTGKSGRVDLIREGNTVTATTRGVREFTLLLSPDQFDFDKPVRVVVNGRVAFDGRVERSVETLTKWSARDHDRTMLFAAELKIRLTA